MATDETYKQKIKIIGDYMHDERKARSNMKNTGGEVDLCSGRTLFLWEDRFTTKNEINLGWHMNDEEAMALGKSEEIFLERRKLCPKV